MQFKQIHEFESNGFDLCNIVSLVNRASKKSFSRRYKNLEAIIDIWWFHLYRRLMKDPAILGGGGGLDDEQLENQHDPPLRTNPPIPASISTDKLTIFSELTSLPNIPSVISLDVNTSESSADELTTEYFHMIRNNHQVKYKYKAIIGKGEKYQKNLKDSLKGRTLIDRV